MYKKHTKTRHPQYRLCTNTTSDCYIPADISIHRNGNIHVISKGLIHIGTPTFVPGTIEQFLANAPAWQKRIWGTAQITIDSINILITHLLNDNVVAGGDGSVQNGQAAHAWCLATKNAFKPIIEGAGPCDTDPTYLASLRPETIA